MMRKKTIRLNILLFLVIFFNFTMASFAEEGHSHFTVSLGSSWKAKESSYFTVFYKEGYEKSADELISNLEYYREKVERLVGNKNPGRTFVTLHDMGIIPNGYYNYLFDSMGAFTYHPQQYFESGENWYRMVGVHEYTHRMQDTNTTGFPQIFVTAFGTYFHPNLYSPLWLAEGIAVYSESRLSQYEGRLNDGNFTSYIKARAKSGEIPTLNDVTHSPLEYPQGGYYLYGSLFLEYLSLKYGEEKFSLFFSAIGSGIFIAGSIFPYFGVDRAAKRIYHKSIKELFSEWKTWEKERAKDWKMDGQRLTNHGWDVFFPILSQDKIYYVRSYPKKTGAFEYFNFNEIMERDLSSGNKKVIVGLTSYVNTPLRIMNNKLYYGIFDVGMGYNSSPDGMGLISSIYERDINTGKDKLIFKDEVRSFSPISSDEIIYAKDRKDEFGSLVFIYSNKNKDKKILFNIPYLIAEILPHGEEIFVVAKKKWENWGIYKLDMANGNLTEIINTPFNEINISLSEGMLYFSANYDGVYRIYGYNLNDKKLFYLTESGYANYPIVSNNNLYFIGLTSEGYDLFSKNIELKEFSMPRYKKSEIPIPYSLEIKEKGYKENLKTLFPKIHIPIPVPPGLYIAGGDAVGENKYALFPYLDIDNNFTPKLNVEILSNFFKPSTIYLQFKARESIGIEWQHHLFMSSAPGLSTIEASLEVGKYNDFKKLYTMPGLSFGFTYPKWDARLFTGYFVEKGYTNGIIIDSYIRRYVQNSQIKLLFDYDYYRNAINSISKDVEIKPRSSSKNPISGYHNLLTLEYSFPFLKIRKGLWNPNIYLEDLSTVFFVESYFNDKNNNAPSFIGGGVELRQEVSLSLQQIKFPIYLGLGIDKDGNKRIYGGISFGSNNGDNILPNIRKRYSSKQW